MARITLVLVLAATAATCCVEAKTDYTARLKAVQTAGAALQVQFSKQWTDVLNGQRQRVVALVTKLVNQQKSPEAKTAMSSLATKIFQNLTTVNSQADTLKKEQGKEINRLVQQYVTLLSQRITATGAAATDEVPIQNLRKRKSTWLALWENRVMDINALYRASYRDVFSAASKAAASKPAVRQALRAAFVDILGEAVVGQEENITLLTAKQFPLVEKFALLAGRVLLELLVTAQGAVL
ncbi:uncharacterized protein LOC117640264 [Thrips palmi]|uniref:Uncharacterized protein LOC117640264 n=1 Tax=Thrips palmi TaxID=161013 RepID=A0A6P8YF51_THRPL|nr:uncharacterized protein LOC117640264 [Thrips palmi]